jgi:UDP-4-amino-4,6-dideoxy-N-acetyl-beta-L-altrosamine transaminase
MSTPQHLPYGRQHVSEEDIAAVVNVLRSEWLTQGPVVPAFECAVADYCDAKHAVAVSSATSALHIACLALDIGTGDLVWTTPNTFVASANCARYCGADVDFVDIDPTTYNLSIDALTEKLTHAKIKGRLPKLLIAVHFAGRSCDMAAISRLSLQYGFKIIEDASHAIGGYYQGRPIGHCQYSDISVFSFHPVKIITTAEGGIATTNNTELANRMRLLRSHGITREKSEFVNADQGAWHYEQHLLGFNYRMTDLQAALGLSQMQRLDTFVKRRNQLAQMYSEHLRNLPLILPAESSPDTISSFHLYVILIDKERTNLSRRELFENLREQNIGVNVHYAPVHLQPYYRELGFKPHDFPIAESYARKNLSLPLFPSMSDADLMSVITCLRSILGEPSVSKEHHDAYLS